jgi:RNA polymerase sigma-70 factor (ECF subfamily)
MGLPATAREPAPARQTALAVDAIYEEHVGYVWRVVQRLGVPETSADDAVQDVFLVVHRKLDAFEGRSSVRTWLYGIALRVARSHRARRRELELPADVPDDRSSPADGAAHLEGIRLLDHLLAQLDDTKREALVLSEIEQLTVPEISELLGVNASTVYSRVGAARKELSEALKRHRARGSWKSGGSS